MSIQDLIASVNDRLTPTERRIAEAITTDPSLLAFGTVTDLADRVARRNDTQINALDQAPTPTRKSSSEVNEPGLGSEPGRGGLEEGGGPL